MGETFFPPTDTVHKTITMQRWMKHWLSTHHSINFSGLCVEMVLELIKERDPETYERYRHLLEENPVKRKETIKKIISEMNTP